MRTLGNIQSRTHAVTSASIALLFLTTMNANAGTVIKCLNVNGGYSYQQSACVDAKQVGQWQTRQISVEEELRYGIKKVKAEKAAALASRQVFTVPSNYQGMYYAPGSVEGVEVKFLVDTGASNVTLPLAMKEQLNLKCESYKKMGTSNGLVDACMSTVSSVKLGPFEVKNVKVALMNTPSFLLGQEFLKNFRVEQENNEIKLITRGSTPTTGYGGGQATLPISGGTASSE